MSAAAAASQSGQDESAPGNAPAVNMPASVGAEPLRAGRLVRDVRAAPLTTPAQTDTTAASDGEHANVDNGEVGDHNDGQQGNVAEQAGNQDEGQQGNVSEQAGNHDTGEQSNSDNGQSGNQDNGGSD